MLPSAEPVRRIAVVSHGDPKVIAEARARAGGDRARPPASRSSRRDDVELAVVLGGDGTMLRALHRFLGTGVPVIGVNFGRVGFLSAMTPGRRWRRASRRAFAGERRVVELPTLDVDVDGTQAVAINDVVCATSTIGRMVELAWAVGGEDLGVPAVRRGDLRDARPARRPTTSRAAGPVLVWGLDAMAVTFVSPHSLHARPLVVPRGLELVVRNETDRDQPPKVIADGMPIGELADRTAGDGPARRAARAARAPAGDDVLPPLPRDLCFVASASRTSS